MKWKCLLTVVIVCVVYGTLHAQSNKLPPFRMVLANGQTYKAEQLPMGKPIVLIYFSPDCDHCQQLMDDFFKKPSAFSNASVVMITYLPVDRVKKFNQQYNTRRFSNIYTGTEGLTFFVKNYYRLSEMPFVALYDKMGNLQLTYNRTVPLADLAARLERLK